MGGQVGLSYELHDPSLRGMLEIDGSCVKFDNTGRCCGAVYFADKEDGDNGIVRTGARPANPLRHREKYLKIHSVRI